MKALSRSRGGGSGTESGEPASAADLNIVRSPPLPDSYDVVKVYPAGYRKLARVSIVRDASTDTYYYFVDEPEFSNSEARELYSIIVSNMPYMHEIRPPAEFTSVAEYEAHIEQVLRAMLERYRMLDAIEKYPELEYYVVRNFMWREIDVVMRDPNIEDLSVPSSSGEAKLYVVTSGALGVPQNWLETNISFSMDRLREMALYIAQRIGKQLSIAMPLAEGRTPEGYRAEVRLDEVGRSPAFTIRKFPESTLTITRLISYGTITPLIAAYLWMMISEKKFITVIGGTGAGKTTMLQSLISLINLDEKVAVVEDTPEINVRRRNTDYMYTRHSIEREKSIELFDLVKRSLRVRPGYIIVGEARGEEMYVAVQASASGHGVMLTFHSEDPFEMFQRIIHPPINVGPAFASTLHVILMQEKVFEPGQGGMRLVRRLTHLWEVTPIYQDYGGEKLPKYIELFRYNIIARRHEPSTAEEAASRSYHLKALAKKLYPDSDERSALRCVAYELENRAKVIEALARRGVYGEDDIARTLAAMNRAILEERYSCPYISSS